MLLVAAMLFTPAAMAQGKFGKFLKKAAKTVLTVPTVTNSTTPTTSGAATEGQVVASADGINLPALTAEHVSITLLGCEGDPATGQIKFSFRATTNVNARFSVAGVNTDYAASADGKRYDLRYFNSLTRDNCDLVPDLPKTYELLISGVPTSVQRLAGISMGFSFAIQGGDYENSGMANVSPLLFRNVPITWTTLPTENIVAWSLPAKQDVDLKVASCVGNKKTGAVSLTLVAKSTGENVRLSLGNSGQTKAFDANGNSYIGKPVGGTYSLQNMQLTADMPVQIKMTYSGVPATESHIHMVRSEFSVKNETNGTYLNTGMADVPDLLIKRIPIQWN